ncbi:MAG: transporter substrate-binding domain-containing protein [Spirochaetales bacterium]|jgi:branched-chain amino acid transport system substrate-binding protein|nr:transporter substrate-binding domain-containing protein [Spirochaetales bacterium]
MVAKREMDNTKDAFAVGILFSQGGSMGLTEISHLKGTLVAIDEINNSGGINGHMIEAAVEESPSDHSWYRRSALKLLAQDRISVLFGCCSSTSRKTVLPLVERFGAVLFYPSFYEGFEYSPNIIYTGAIPNQTVIPLASYLFKNHGKRFFLIGSEYVYPREINRIVGEFLSESGGTIADEIYIPLDSDLKSYMTIAKLIKASDADVVLSTVVGSDTPKFYEACWKSGINPEILPIASLTTSENELAELPSEARIGHVTGASYFSSINTNESTKFKELFAARYGNEEKTNIYSETAYFQVHLFAKAARITEDISAEALLKVLSGMEFVSPQGYIKIDSENNHLYLTPRIGVSQEDGSFKIVWESESLVKPDPYLVSYGRTISASVNE